VCLSDRAESAGTAASGTGRIQESATKETEP
jgi:hypothetical protein